MSQENLAEELIEIRTKIADLRFFSKKAREDHDYNEGLDDSLMVIDSHLDRMQNPT